MAKGLALPLGVTAAGGTRLSEGDEQSDKIIALALSDNDNDNAFQQSIGLGVKEVFDLANAGVRAKVLSRIVQIFGAFEREKLFKLVPGTVVWRKGPQAGDTTLEFTYINLEQDKPKRFARNFTASGKV